MRCRVALALLMCTVAVATPVFVEGSAAGAAEPNTTKGAVAAVKERLELINDRQWDRLYKSLYPGQQAQISPSAFAACSDETYKGTTAKIDDIVETHTEKVAVPGTTDNVKSVSVSFRGTAETGPTTQQFRTTIHAIYADGRWRFALSQSEFDHCRQAT